MPTYFRTLDRDCVADPYLHELMQRADVVMPWMVQRFRSLSEGVMRRYSEHVKADLTWCRERGIDYVPVVYPGFSWHNLSRHKDGRSGPLDQNPRQGGRFYWGLIHGAISAGSEMLYVAMFDEMDEGTAIFKCTNNAPVDFPCLTYEGLASDYYLWLTGQAGRMLRREIAIEEDLPTRIPSP